MRYRAKILRTDHQVIKATFFTIGLGVIVLFILSINILSNYSCLFMKHYKHITHNILRIYLHILT